MKTNFKKGDKVIWDSGFGYDIGYFMQECETQYYAYQLDMVSGIITGIHDFPRNEVFPYNKKTAAEVYKKYKYKKTFK